MSTESAAGRRQRSPYRAMVTAYICVIVLGIGLAWAFLAMRDVMGVGGACASGGPYEIATPCPDGTWLIAIAIPAMMLAMFIGSYAASTVGGPTLLLPMWGFLFCSLGWNFLEFGLVDGIVWGWLICGVMFEAMGLPALYAIAVGAVRSLKPKDEAAEAKPGQTVLWSSSSLVAGVWWWPVYTALGISGAILGLGTYVAVAT